MTALNLIPVNHPQTTARLFQTAGEWYAALPDGTVKNLAHVLGTDRIKMATDLQVNKIVHREGVKALRRL